MIRLGTTGTVLEGAILVMEILGVRSLTAHPRVVCVVKGMWGRFPMDRIFFSISFFPILLQLFQSHGGGLLVVYAPALLFLRDLLVGPMLG